MTSVVALLDALFPTGHAVAVEGALVRGSARTGAGEVAVLGIAGGAPIDAALALGLSEHVLATLDGPPRPLVFLVDTSGQALRRHEELIGLNAYLAHLAQCVDVARREGFPSLSLVYGEAVSGGYLSLGMMADRAYALADARIRVMDLTAMARVTRIARDELERLARESPVFAPGARNYEQMGALTALWPAPSAALLGSALRELLQEASPAGDRRLALGHERGGRPLAQTTAATVLRGR